MQPGHTIPTVCTIRTICRLPAASLWPNLSSLTSGVLFWTTPFQQTYSVPSRCRNCISLNEDAFPLKSMERWTVYCSVVCRFFFWILRLCFLSFLFTKRRVLWAIICWRAMYLPTRCCCITTSGNIFCCPLIVSLCAFPYPHYIRHQMLPCHALMTPYPQPIMHLCPAHPSQATHG